MESCHAGLAEAVIGLLLWRDFPFCWTWELSRFCLEGGLMDPFSLAEANFDKSFCLCTGNLDTESGLHFGGENTSKPLASTFSSSGIGKCCLDAAFFVFCSLKFRRVSKAWSNSNCKVSVSLAALSRCSPQALRERSKERKNSFPNLDRASSP